MTGRFLAICVCASGVALWAGCSGMEPAPRPVGPEVVEFAEPREPNEPDATAWIQSEPAAAESYRVEVPPPRQEDRGTTEPNEPDLAEQGDIGPEEQQKVVEPNDVEPVEPNEIDVGRAEVSAEPQHEEAVEPNAAAAEPNEAAAPAGAPSEPATDAGRAPAWPAFVAQYAEILQDYVRADGRVDYSSLRRRRLQLKRLLMTLDEMDPNAYRAWTPHAKLAFWINAYNLKMLEIIARNYPIESSWWLRLTWPPSDIRHIKGIWTDYKCIVLDEEFTLTTMERRFFRAAFDDARAYLAITYACRSSPPLRRRPYRPDNLDQQLDDQVRRFLADPRGCRIDRQKRVVYLSALFKPSWRGKEFVSRYGTDKKFKERGPETRAVLNFVTSYLSREDVYFLEVENYAIAYMNFDWRLNDAARGS
jgi:hypothetical protein